MGRKRGKRTLQVLDVSCRRKGRSKGVSIGIDGAILGKRTRSGISGRKPGSRSANSALPKIFKCHLESCAKIFNDRASLKKHMTVHGDKLVSKYHPAIQSSDPLALLKF